jgi:hypothetical protein
MSITEILGNNEFVAAGNLKPFHDLIENNTEVRQLFGEELVAKAKLIKVCYYGTTETM